MLTHICDFNHKAWDYFKIKTTIVVVIGGSLFLLCACVKQGHSTVTPTDASLPTRTAAPTPTTLPVPTHTPLPSDVVYPRPSPATGLAADLAIQVSEPVQVVPGETTIYTLTVRNHGPDPATDILLTDDLPIGVIPVWAQSAQPLCGRQESNVSCNVGDLWGGDAITVTLNLSVGGTEALITGTQLSGVTLVLSAPTCAIDQDSAPPRVTCRLANLQPGADAHMRIGVDVDGPVTGTLIHTATVAASEADANRSNNRATFTMTVGTATPVTITSAPVATDLVLQADGPSSVIAGRPFTYAFTITNRGTLDATGVTFENALPLTADLDAYAPGLPRCEQRDDAHRPDAFTCALRDPDSGETITFTLVITGHGGQPMVMEPDPLMPGWPICTVLKERTYLHILICEFGVLKPGQATQVQMVLTARGVQERMMANTASVTANEDDLNLLDNTNTTTITVLVRADLSVRSALSGPAFAGETLSYTLTVANLGPSDANGVVLADTLPTGTRLVSAVPSQGDDCRIDTSTDTVLCSLARLNGGETATVTIVVEVDETLTLPSAESILHSAKVVAEQADPNPHNNELTQVIPVSAGIED